MAFFQRGSIVVTCPERIAFSQYELNRETRFKGLCTWYMFMLNHGLPSPIPNLKLLPLFL